MWEPRRLTNLWAFTACYRDSFSFFIERLHLKEGLIQKMFVSLLTSEINHFFNLRIYILCKCKQYAIKFIRRLEKILGLLLSGMLRNFDPRHNMCRHMCVYIYIYIYTWKYAAEKNTLTQKGESDRSFREACAIRRYIVCNLQWS
jgi:hypothetical protein